VKGADSRTVDAVVRNLEIIGEAARSIPVEIKQDQPAIVVRDLPVLDVQLRDWIKEHQ
jgi:uncharacterized protein with HEPN domain